MTEKPTTPQTEDQQDLNRAVRKRFTQVIILFLFQAVILFASSGQLDWVNAWVLLGINLVIFAINGYFMLRYSPDTAAERAESRDMEDWDKVLGGLAYLMYAVGILLVSGLDQRFGWTGDLSLGIRVLGAVLYILGQLLFSWSMISNAFFSARVRIQDDRDHVVVTTGPYAFVRHPGYVGMIIQSFAISLLLESLWALIPGVIAVCSVVARTAFEDKMLQDELPGYAEYADKVKYRLVPGIW
ncbi:MAG: isoprenylcysteine carboxylmethyltransferase family protein [Anaerolineales bacterium]|nr:isoprenylcysteine carboxylmethyltransferase family protein [Anaerolineales bacterium]